ncbi:MAG: ATP-binding protein [Candidatus Thermoplasmatota archaeon]|nr:ATP-binding protein [Candidatus Thermoplasmatota archaeon]
MEKTKFVNRVGEINILKDSWKKNTAQFIVIYGRRRIGKTEVIKQFMKEKQGIYFLGRLETTKDQLTRISMLLSDFFSDSLLQKSPLASWDAVFEYLYKNNKKYVIAFDEFPYMVKTSPEILSIFQDYWDNKLRFSKLFFIVCGSSLSMMEKYIFEYKTPLYGRRTLDLKIAPLSFVDAWSFFQNLTIEKAIQAYGVLGGTPAYLLEFEKDISSTIEKICMKRSFLFREPEFILREEVSEPRFFFSILHAISIGKTRSGDIINHTGLDKGLVGKYLSVLVDLDLIRREIPITDSWKSRKGNYYINDEFFRFWFRFIYPNLDVLETNPSDVPKKIKKQLDHYLGETFEMICRQFLIKTGDVSSMSMGRWWYKDEEIDIVALDEEKKNALFIECKWQDLSYGETRQLLQNLEKKAKMVQWYNEKRNEHYGIISKNIENKDLLRKEGFIVYDLRDWMMINKKMERKKEK